MKDSPNTISIDGVNYYKESKNVVDSNGLPYMMVRTYSAGVFAGYLAERNGKEARLIYARRIYYWSGAASLSQLATEGTSKPKECKFPITVSEVILTEVIELIPITDIAKKSIEGVQVWKT